MSYSKTITFVPGETLDDETWTIKIEHVKHHECKCDKIEVLHVFGVSAFVFGATDIDGDGLEV